MNPSEIRSVAGTSVPADNGRGTSADPNAVPATTWNRRRLIRETGIMGLLFDLADRYAAAGLKCQVRSGIFGLISRRHADTGKCPRQI
jgi:hypothetical protein